MKQRTVVFNGLLAIATLATGILAAAGDDKPSSPFWKRDKSGVPSSISHEGCALRNWRKITPGAKMFCNEGIQAGECDLNARVMNQLFAVFEPDAGDLMASREGGPYGSCCAFSRWPSDDDLIEVPNPNYYCFGWTGPEKEQYDGPPPAGFTGQLAYVYPLICPNTLKNCYSENYYETSGKVEKFATVRWPNTSALWIPPKSHQEDHKGGKHPFLWCNHRGAGCPMTSNFGFQAQHIADLKCDVASCKPYEGDMTVLPKGDRSSYAVKRGTVAEMYGQCIPEEDAYCKNARNGAKSGSGSGSTDGPSTGNSGSSTTYPPGGDDDVYSGGNGPKPGKKTSPSNGPSTSTGDDGTIESGTGTGTGTGSGNGTKDKSGNKSSPKSGSNAENDGQTQPSNGPTEDSTQETYPSSPKTKNGNDNSSHKKKNKTHDETYEPGTGTNTKGKNGSKNSAKQGPSGDQSNGEDNYSTPSKSKSSGQTNEDGVAPCDAPGSSKPKSKNQSTGNEDADPAYSRRGLHSKHAHLGNKRAWQL